MDHVKLPASKQYQPLVVEYACTVEYDGGDFFGYPDRCGWSQSDIFSRANWKDRESNARRDNDERHTQGPTSFLQNWLFFGLLHSILGPSLKDGAFVRFDADVGGHVITTDRLMEHVSDAVARWRLLSNEASLLQTVLVDRILTWALHVFDFVCHATDLNPAIVFSIAILGDLLAYLRNAVLWAGKPHTRELIFHWPSGDPTSNVISTRMLSRGWCESHVIRAMRLTPSARYFISQLDAPNPRNNHISCGKFRCLGYELDWDTYQTHHVQDSCVCNFLSVSAGDLTSMLSNDEIPVISTSQLLANGFAGQIPVVSHKRQTSYIAISHVWSDYRGNPRDNALPICQLQFLVDCVQKLYPDIPPSTLPGLWIDTICCPVSPRWARNKAIVLMRETYSAAEKVLVIEDYILKCPFPSDTMFEPFARIYLSTWTTRLWTMQEGIMARKLFIQFKNKAMNFEDSWKALLQSHESLLEIHNNLAWPINIRGGLSTTNSAFSSVSNLRIAVHERFTSWSTDEAICLGTLMGADMEKLLSVPPKQRMQQFWTLLPHIPAYVVFWSGKRITGIPGLGWAPASFLNSRLYTFKSDIMNNNVHGTRMEEGLKVSFPGLRLTSVSESRVNRHFWLRDKHGEFRYWFCGQFDPEKQESLTMMGIREEQTEPDSGPISLAMITEYPLNLTNSDAPGQGAGGSRIFAGALVKVLREDDSTIYAEIVNVGDVYHGSPSIIPATHHREALAQSIILGKRMRPGLDAATDQPSLNPPTAPTDYGREKDSSHTDTNTELPKELTQYEAEFKAPECVEELGLEQVWCIV